jgi:hypothetical protein
MKNRSRYVEKKRREGADEKLNAMYCTTLTVYVIIALHFSSAERWYSSFNVRALYAGVRSRFTNLGTKPHLTIWTRKSCR